MEDKIVGCLFGSAIGDALGLPMEGLSRRRQHKMFSNPGSYHFIGGRGMVSDDTEHAVIVAQALTLSAGRPTEFTRYLAWRLKLWFLGLPAGVGLATSRAIIKLIAGWPPDKSGVFSAGNGPAMRSGIIGVCYRRDPEQMLELVRISTRITHTDPKAEYGALAVALAAGHAADGKHAPEAYIAELKDLLGSEADELIGLIEGAGASALAGRSTIDFAEQLGLARGVTGYMYHTVPVALHAWFLHPLDITSALTGVIRCGGDTDTVASITGSILGAGVGRREIPEPLIDGLLEWPMTISRIEALGLDLGRSLMENQPLRPRETAFLFRLVRNLFFLAIVLSHGFRRLLPPY